MSLLFQLTKLSCSYREATNRSSSLFLLLILSLALSVLTGCKGAAVFANEPEPKVLSPTTVTQPSEDIAVAELTSTKPVSPTESISLTESSSTEVASAQYVPTVASPLDVPVAPSEEPVQDAAIAAPSSCSRTSLSLSDTVNIGLLAPMSNSIAEFAGQAMRTSANLAEDDIEAAGGVMGRQVTLIAGDTQGDPEIARQEAIRLITEECVVGLVGVYHSSVGLEIKEVAREYGVPVIFSAPFSDEILADQYDEVFRIGPSTSMVNLGFARWVRNIGDFNEDGITLVTIIAENSASNVERVESFTEVLNRLDLNVRPLLVDSNSIDFSSVIARLVAGSNLPDFVFVWVNGNPGYTLLRELNSASIGPNNRTVVVARQMALDHSRFWQELPNGVQTVVSRIGPWHTTITSKGQTFVDRYQARYGFWPESYAFASYDAVWLLADAISRAGTTASPAVIRALEETNIELASGVYCFPRAEGLASAPNSGVSSQAECGTSYNETYHQWPNSPILFLQYTQSGQSSEEMSVIWPHSFQNSISTLLTTE